MTHQPWGTHGLLYSRPQDAWLELKIGRANPGFKVRITRFRAPCANSECLTPGQWQLADAEMNESGVFCRRCLTKEVYAVRTAVYAFTEAQRTADNLMQGQMNMTEEADGGDDQPEESEPFPDFDPAESAVGLNGCEAEDYLPRTFAQLQPYRPVPAKPIVPTADDNGLTRVMPGSSSSSENQHFGKNNMATRSPPKTTTQGVRFKRKLKNGVVECGARDENGHEIITRRVRGKWAKMAAVLCFL